MTLMSKLTALVLLAFITFQFAHAENTSPTSATPFPFKPFTAKYRGEAYDMNLDDLGTRTLTSLGDGRYRVEYHAKAMMYSMEESSEFLWQDNRIVPQHYQSEKGTFISKRKSGIHFDWQNGVAHFKYKKREGQFPVQAGDQDPITSAFKLAIDIAAGKQEIELREAKKDNVHPRKFELIDEPELNTPLGKIKTVHLKRVHDSDKRETEIWVHKDYPHIPVRLWQDDEGDVFLLELTGLTL